MTRQEDSDEALPPVVSVPLQQRTPSQDVSVLSNQSLLRVRYPTLNNEETANEEEANAGPGMDQVPEEVEEELSAHQTIESSEKKTDPAVSSSQESTVPTDTTAKVNEVPSKVSDSGEALRATFRPKVPLDACDGKTLLPPVGVGNTTSQPSTFRPKLPLDAKAGAGKLPPVSTTSDNSGVASFFAELRDSSPEDRNPSDLVTTIGVGTTFPSAGPGAYPLGASSADRGAYATYPLGASADNGAPSAEQQQEEPSSGGLAVANPVAEDYSPTTGLPRAVGMDENNNSARAKENRCRVALGMMALLVVVMGSCSLAVFLTQETQSNNPEATSKAPTTSPSSSPTQTPTSVEGYLLSLLPNSSLEFLEEEGSPQAKAYGWLVEDIRHNPWIPEHRIQQRFALASFYHATAGANWFFHTDWLDHNSHECLWFQQGSFAFKVQLGVLFPGYLEEFPPVEEPTPACNANGELVRLWLDTNNLAGALPLELYSLSALQTVSFGFNAGLSGSIATEIARLTALEGFIHMNIVEGGTVPSEIGLLTGLRGLGLYGNGHTGRVPTEIWRLSNLSTLVMGGPSSNPQTGSIPTEIGLISNLRWFHITETAFDGTIPSEIGMLSKLEWCTLEQNQYSGQLPSELGLLTSMTLLSLWRNSLTGTLPTQIGEMTPLTLFTVLLNQLTGTIPTQIGKLTNIKDLLDLGQNPFQGKIPTEIGLITNLEEFNVNRTSMTGPIPSQLGLLTAMQWLGVAENNLTGSFPNELSSLKDTLYLLELNGNAMLTGTLPNDLCYINRTCTQSSIKECEGRQGLIFDCTATFSGCNCTEA